MIQRSIEIPGEADARALWIEPESVATPPDRVVILIHGGGNDRLFGFLDLIEALIHTNSFYVLTFHLPGHGQGGSDLFDLTTTRKRIDLVLDYVKNTHPLAQRLILGQSLGGAFAIDLLSRTQDPLKVIAVSPLYQLRLGLGIIKELLTFLRPHLWRSMIRHGIAHFLPAFGPIGRNRLPVRVKNGQNYIYCFQQTLSQLNLMSNSHRPSTQDLGSQLVLIHGEQDGIVPVQQAQDLQSHWGCKLLLKAKTGHFDVLLNPAVIRDIVHIYEK